jgi:hypothetical protein
MQRHFFLKASQGKNKQALKNKVVSACCISGIASYEAQKHVLPHCCDKK